MGKKLTGIIAFTLAIILSFAVTNLKEDKNYRFHQHMEAVEKTACNHNENVFCTHLPLVEINTHGSLIPGEAVRDEEGLRVSYTTTGDGYSELTCSIQITDNDGENNHTNDSPSIESDMRIRIRGNSSRNFEKKGYKITLINEKGENNPQMVMGMDSHHEWVLHGPYLDKTLIRNYMWYNIAGEIMGYAPNVRFCEVMINGEYNGLYLMTESITAGKDGARLDISVDKKDNSFTGYILRLDRGSENPLKNIEPFSVCSYRITNGHMNIVYPGGLNLTDELTESIRQDFSAFEHMLYSFDFDHSKYGYSKTVDVDSFVNYFLINEFTCNYDAGTYSTYIYKGIDGKFSMCVWDFNNACDNYQEQAVDDEMFTLQECLWYYMIIKDEDFTDSIIDRYYELRKTYFGDEYLNDYIDNTIKYLGDAIDRNFEKWGTSFEKNGSHRGKLYPIERNIESYDEAISQLKGFISKRGEWMDENIEVLRQYSADSKTKLYKEHTR